MKKLIIFLGCLSIYATVPAMQKAVNLIYSSHPDGSEYTPAEYQEQQKYGRLLTFKEKATRFFARHFTCFHNCTKKTNSKYAHQSISSTSAGQ